MTNEYELAGLRAEVEKLNLERRALRDFMFDLSDFMLDLSVDLASAEASDRHQSSSVAVAFRQLRHLISEQLLPKENHNGK